MNVLSDDQDPWLHLLQLGHPQGGRHRRDMCHVGGLRLYGLLYGFLLYFALFRYFAPYITHALSRLLSGAIQPYSPIQRCMSIQLYSTIHYTAHTTPLSADAVEARAGLVSATTMRDGDTAS